MYLLPEDGIDSPRVALRPLRHFEQVEYLGVLIVLGALGDLTLAHIAHYFAPRTFGDEGVEEAVDLLEGLPGDVLLASGFRR